MLIDEILSRMKSQDPMRRTFMDHVRQSTVMKVQNVADYVFENPAMEWRIGQDFPNIAISNYSPQPILN